MSLRERVTRQVVEPAALRFQRWRGDPVARLIGPDTWVDPYPLYRDLRSRGLVRSPLGPYATASHATATRVLRDQRFSSSPVHQANDRAPVYTDRDPRADLPAADLLTMDPPDHTRIRRLVAKAFSPRAISALEPMIRETTERLLAAVDVSAGFDLVDALAFPLPIAVICHLLGVPVEDNARFRAWGHDLASSLEPQTSCNSEARTRASELALTQYLQELVRRRRADPDDSLLSALVAVEDEGSRLSPGELVSTALLLLVAGFETTVNLIGNGTVALLGSPEQWRRLGDDVALVPDALDELLRYDSPVQMTSRTATEDLDLEGAKLRRGTPIIVSIGGANRDPDVFENPDQLDIGRRDANRHLAFSLGLHHCLGAALARLEGRVVFEQLTSRYPSLELAGAPTRRHLVVLRGFETIPVRVS